MKAKINFDNLVRQLTPPHKRQPVRIGLLRSLVRPLADKFESYDRWSERIRRHINTASQKYVLEQHLKNKYADVVLNAEIVSVRESGILVSLRIEDYPHMVLAAVDSRPATGAVMIPVRGYSNTGLGGMDFEVNLRVSQAFTERHMHEIFYEIRKYCLFNMKFEIKITKQEQ